MIRNALRTLPIVLFVGSLSACSKPAPSASPKPPDSQQDPEHTHTEGDGHTHGDDHSHGPTVALGEQTVGTYQIKASRDGDIKAGGDAPIDVWVTGEPKVQAVRIWIGAEDGKGSLKARAELEKENWHTHVEVPTPLAADAKLWIEIEAEGGTKTIVSFDLATGAAK